MISGKALEMRGRGTVLGIVLLGVAALQSAYGDAVLWHHFDERAPGETAQASDVFTNSVSASYGSGRAAGGRGDHRLHRRGSHNARHPAAEQVPAPVQAA